MKRMKSPKTKMSLVLLIESSSRNCSVAVARNGKILAIEERSSDKYIHAESLHPFIAKCLADCQCEMKNLDAVAISSGPGSYTGLRIGISAAKGICFALNIPLITIPTTQILATYAFNQSLERDLIIPMIDARRMEVYYAVYDMNLDKISTEAAAILEPSFFDTWANKRVVFVGDGAFKCADFISIKDIILPALPSASMMAGIADPHFRQEKFSELSSFEPFYLKEYVPVPPKKIL